MKKPLVRVPKSRSIVGDLKTNAKEISTGTAKVYHLPDWGRLSHPERLGVLRRIAMSRGRDPHIAKQAVAILRSAGVQPREYDKQAAALLKWVQDPKNFYYVNEPGERLQDPLVTLRLRTGDCDDAVLLLCALFESVGLPWRYVLSGRDNQTKKKLRYIEGEAVPPNTSWAHIYCMVGTPPFQPKKWFFCEPTVQGVPLGWDVISGDASFLPEMAKPIKGPPRLMLPGKAVPGFRPKPLPPVGRRSPAYAMAYGGFLVPNSSVGTAVGASVAEAATGPGRMDWQKIGTAVVTGVAVSVTTQIILDWVNGRGIWESSGHVFSRLGRVFRRSV